MSSFEIEPTFLSMNSNEQLKEIVMKVKDINLNIVSTEPYTHIGEIEAIIDGSEMITVKPKPSKTLLDFGTQMFVKRTIPESSTINVNYYLIGHVEDVFGPVSSPMYAIKLASNKIDFFPGENIYYLYDNETKLLQISSLHKENKNNEKFSFK